MRSPALPQLPLFLLGLLAMSSSAWATAPVGASFAEGDWFMVCDNTRACRIAGVGASAPLRLAALIERNGGPGEAVDIRLVLARDDADDPEAQAQSPVGALHLQLDGERVGSIGALESATEHAKLTPAQVQAFNTALIRQSRISITDGRGQTWSLSASGAAALMLKMDQIQHRLDTPGALVQRGSRPESSVPPALPKPVLAMPSKRAPPREEDARLGERENLRRLLRPDNKADWACAADVPQTSAPYIAIQRLDDHHVLASVVCHIPGFNVPGGTWSINDQAPFNPVFITQGALFPYSRELMFVEETVETDRDRCGTGRYWAWDGQRMQLSMEYVGGTCSGAGASTWRLPTYITEFR
ncbi:TPA: DUF1176 domain-containing protein [Stenotrophomonas maltophilia]|nr:DUF1176 domain-containing protein [Stenotrophomonas maltophilia]HEL3786574.1 DUF1176 domain-containing protein [Stenotrophomonas maltophilia]